MTDQETIIAIATAHGWKNIKCLYGGNVYYGEPDDDFNRDVVEHKKHGLCGFPSEPHAEPLLDYLNSLDAMHEAEQTLDNDDRREFDEILMDEVGIHGAIHATAAQRAQAFVRTIAARAEREARRAGE